MSVHVIERNPYYVPRKVSVDEAVAAKMKVLREFCVVNEHNADAIEAQLRKAIKEQPGKDYERILDREAHVLIERKLNGE